MLHVTGITTYYFLKENQMQKRVTPSNLHSFLLLTLLTAVVFGNTLGHGFVLDDRNFVTYKEAYRNLDIATILFSLKTNDLEYLPVRDLSYVVDFALWGKTAAGFHFSNVVWYWMNVIAVYLLSTKLAVLFRENVADQESDGFSRVNGLFAAALFAVHPIHCETVNFITCRNALVSGACFCFSSFSYLQHLTTPPSQMRRLFYWISFVCFVLSLFAKATGIILPLFLLICTCYFGRPLCKQRWVELLPFFLMSGGGFFLFRSVALKTRIIPEVPFCATAACLSEKFATALQIPLFYLKKLCIPSGYTVDYNLEQFGTSLSDVRSVIALAVTIGTGIIVWHLRQRKPLLLFCCAWYLITLIPVLHIFPTVPTVADRYAFLPSLPFIIIISATFTQFLEERRTVLAWLCLLFVAGLSTISIQQNQTWKNEKTLWEYTLHVNPRSSAALSVLARLSFYQDKNYNKALELARKANEVNNNNLEFDRLRGELSLRNRRPDYAVVLFKSALDKDPEDVETLVSLGRAYEMLGDKMTAKRYYQSAINSHQVYLPGNMREKAVIFLQNLEQ